MGVARLPGALYEDRILALPRAFGARLGSERTGVRAELLVDTPEPVSWEDVLEANREGVLVRSGAVIVDPPPCVDVPLYAGSSSDDGGPGADEIALVVVVAGMAVLEIVLLAGAAFAVGARRQSRSPALVAAAGG